MSKFKGIYFVYLPNACTNSIVKIKCYSEVSILHTSLTNLALTNGNLKYIKQFVNNTPKCQPVLSATNAPTYLLAKYLNPILSPLITNEYTVKTSFDFAE